MLSGQHALFPKINGHQVTEQLGQGQFGTVYKIIKNDTKNEFALKVWDRIHKTDDEKAITPEDERQSWEKLQVFFSKLDPNTDWTVTLTETTGTDQKPALIMPLIPYPSIMSFYNRKQLSSQMILNIMTASLQSLCLLHQQGYAHCDLKPENILYGNEKAWLIDFGSLLGIGAGWEGRGGFTPQYLAPEALKIETRPKAKPAMLDVFALGTIFAAMLDIANLWSETNPSQPSTLACDARKELRVDNAIIQLIQKMMAPIDNRISAEDAYSLLKNLAEQTAINHINAILVRNPSVSTEIVTEKNTEISNINPATFHFQPMTSDRINTDEMPASNSPSESSDTTEPSDASSDETAGPFITAAGVLGITTSILLFSAMSHVIFALVFLGSLIVTAKGISMTHQRYGCFFPQTRSSTDTSPDDDRDFSYSP